MLTSLIAISLSALSNSSYPIQTTDGKTVQVSADALANAYSRLLNDRDAINSPVTNDDGSISIVEPRFLYAGHLVQLHSPFDPQHGETRPEGLCAHYKLGSFVTSEDFSDTQNSTQSVLLDAGGALTGVAYGGYGIHILTCKAR